MIADFRRAAVHEPPGEPVVERYGPGPRDKALLLTTWGALGASLVFQVLLGGTQWLVVDVWRRASLLRPGVFEV